MGNTRFVVLKDHAHPKSFAKFFHVRKPASKATFNKRSLAKQNKRSRRKSSRMHVAL